MNFRSTGVSIRKALTTGICAVAAALTIMAPACFGGYEATVPSKPQKPTARAEDVLDLTSYVSYVTARYDRVRELVHGNNTSSKLKITSSVNLHIAQGQRIRLDIAKGTDDMNYYRQFTYDTDGSMVFCYYENSTESYRMYFYRDELVKMIYRNEKTGEKQVSSLAEAQSAYSDWAEYAVYEAYYYPSIVDY